MSDLGNVTSVIKFPLTEATFSVRLIPESEATNAKVTEAYIGEYADWNLSDVKSAGHCPDPDCERCLPDTRDWGTNERTCLLEDGDEEPPCGDDLDCSCGMC